METWVGVYTVKHKLVKLYGPTCWSPILRALGRVSQCFSWGFFFLKVFFRTLATYGNYICSWALLFRFDHVDSTSSYHDRGPAAEWLRAIGNTCCGWKQGFPFLHFFHPCSRWIFSWAPPEIVSRPASPKIPSTEHSQSFSLSWVREG